MTALVKANAPLAMRKNAIAIGWKWRTSSEGDILPNSMETRHLFYTLRMIWNHTMPRHMEVGYNVKRWAFSARHNPQYMRQAVVQIGAELFRRDDLKPWMMRELDQMARWLGEISASHFIENGVAGRLEDLR